MRAASVLAQRSVRNVGRPEAAYLLNGRESQIDFQDASRISFESCAPVRSFTSWRGKRNYSGSYWSSTMHKHVGFESLYERTALMVLDREPTVVAISSQPMWIFWPTASTPTSHAPDFFVRHDNGDGEIVDVRPHERIDDSAAASFEATRQLCDQHGFRYRVMSTLDRTVDQNLRFLARYREPQWKPPLDRVARLEEILDRPLSIRFIGSWISHEDQGSAALGWVYWLIWSGHLDADLRVPIRLAYTAFGQGNVERLTRSTSTTSYTSSALGLTRETLAGGAQRNYTRTSDGTATSTRFGAGSKYYYITDALGSVIGMFDKTGAYAGGYSYSPYGETRNTITAGSAADSNSLRYISGYADRGSGLYKLGARYYDPSIGRFTQYDPSGQEGNPYTYGASDPINNLDPSGLSFVSVVNYILEVIDGVMTLGSIDAALNAQSPAQLIGVVADFAFGAACGAATAAAAATVVGALITAGLSLAIATYAGLSCRGSCQ